MSTDRIIIEPIYMGHEGGTKFYEVTTLWNEKRRKGVLIRRWGPVTKRMGGGETKIELYGDVRKLQDAQRKALSEKGGRGYSTTSFDFGLHSSKKDVSAGKGFAKSVERHFANADFRTILMQLEVDPSAEDDDMRPTKDDEIVTEEPKPEPVRDADWGSW